MNFLCVQEEDESRLLRARKCRNGRSASEMLSGEEKEEVMSRLFGRLLLLKLCEVVVVGRRSLLAKSGNNLAIQVGFLEAFVNDTTALIWR